MNANSWNSIVCYVLKSLSFTRNTKFSLRTTHIINTHIVFHDKIKYWTKYLKFHVISVFIKHQKWKNTRVPFLQHFYDRNQTCSLNALLMFNSGFNIYPTWNWCGFYLFHSLTYYFPYAKESGNDMQSTDTAMELIGTINIFRICYYKRHLYLLHWFSHELTLYLSIFTEWHYFEN